MMLTNAQFVIARQHLRATLCPTCGGAKRTLWCFCKRCYFTLPEEMRAPLWLHRYTREALLEWTQNYLDAKQYLRNLYDQGELFTA